MELVLMDLGIYMFINHIMTQILHRVDCMGSLTNVIQIIMHIMGIAYKNVLRTHTKINLIIIVPICLINNQ